MQLKNVILIDLHTTYTQRRCTLVHELVHYYYQDAGRDGLYATSCERRARRETACTLINPAAYARAEEMYDADRYSIADELDVTVGIVDDYQSLLREWCCQGRSLDYDRSGSVPASA